MSFSCVEEIRAWQAAYAFKLAVYELIRTTAIEHDFELRQQLRKAAASAVSQMEEGFARFYPKDFGRLAVGAKASLAEARGHLRDAVDSGHIGDEQRTACDALAVEALKETTGLIDYLQSPEAEENAKRIRAQRAKKSKVRTAARRHAEPRTRNPNPNPEPEQRTRTTNTNEEPGTRNPERE